MTGDSGRRAARSLRPISVAAVAIGSLAFLAGVWLYNWFPPEFHGYLHGLVFAPLAGGGLALTGGGLLLSWKNLGLVLRAIAVLLLLVGSLPFLIAGALIVYGMIG